MTRYVALLRGITPTNPKMKNEKLRAHFEDLGFSSVRTVISSGNVVFETPSRAASSLEEKIEKTLPVKLGFRSATILRSLAQFERLVDANPFRGIEDGPTARLNVTFLKRPPPVRLRFPYRAGDGSFKLVGIHEQAICSVTDMTRARTPDLMGWLDKMYGKEITTRTWRTVERILRVLRGG